MKYLLPTLFIFYLIISPAIAITGQVPQWDEFCPPQYFNAQIIPEENIIVESQKSIKRTENKFIGMMKIITVIPIMYDSSIIYSRMKQIREDNQNIVYWDVRHEQFKANLATCSATDPNTRAMCYMKAREIEQQKDRDKEQMAFNRALINQQSMNRMNQSFQMMNNTNTLNNLNNTIRYRY